MIRKVIKVGVKLILGPLGYQVKRANDEKAEGFPGYLHDAKKVRSDVNDWEERQLLWEPAIPILERTVFPYLQNDFVVCELGVGTGRFSRHIATKLVKGELHLVDHSPWIADFLRKYFKRNSHIKVHLNDGYSLPFSENSWIDFVFSTGTFIALKLGCFYLYSLEFYRVLKPGGYCVIDYIDISTPAGWNHLESNSKGGAAYCYTYHTTEVVDKVFSSVGFEILERHQMGKSTYLIARKPKQPPISL